LRQRKDGHAAKEEQRDANGSFAEQGKQRGERPDQPGDQLAGKTAEEGAAHLTLGIMQGHRFAPCV
jgi:hypothetical protein